MNTNTKKFLMKSARFPMGLTAFILHSVIKDWNPNDDMGMPAYVRIQGITSEPDTAASYIEAVSFDGKIYTFGDDCLTVQKLQELAEEHKNSTGEVKFGWGDSLMRIKRLEAGNVGDYTDPAGEPIAEMQFFWG